MEVSIRKRDVKIQEPVRQNFIHELNKFKLNSIKSNVVKKAAEDIKLMNTIVEKINDNSSILTKADKSNAIVVIQKTDYESKVETFLNNKKFKILKKDPTNEFTKSANSAITQCKSITKYDVRSRPA